MKKLTVFFSLLIIAGLVLSSCYTYSIDYGKGPQKYIETEKINNHYFLWGLVNSEVEVPEGPKSGSGDYNLTIKHTFLDGLLQAITFGIYAPTTTTITE